MSFAVQDDTGLVAGANSYLSVEAFDAYHVDRGNSLGSATSQAKQTALIRATDYLDQRFRYRGWKLNNNTQPTEWPRYNAYDNANYGIYGIPKAVKDACAEYALRALTASSGLNPDPRRDASGRRVQSFSKAVAGAVSKSVTYADAGEVELPEYPAADLKLVRAGLTVGNNRSGDIRRA